MTIDDKFAKLELDLKNAYDALEQGGATMPQNKNYHNLAATIGTIPLLSDYGRVTYYSVFTTSEFQTNESTNLVINSLDADKFYNYAQNRGWILSNGKTNIWYWLDGSNLMVSAETSYGSWENNIPASQLENNAGIVVSLQGSSAGNLILGGFVAGTVDTTSPQVTAELLSNAEFQTLANSSSSAVNYTVHGQTIPRAAVTGFEFGSIPTSAPAYFLAYAPVTSVTKIEKSNIITLGTRFLAYCTSFNQALDLSKVTTIGSNLLTGCTVFNSPITLSSTASLNTLGFLASCSAFNQPVTLPSTLTSFSTGFMSGCSSFNQPLTIPAAVTTIGQSFLHGCSSFNQPLTLHEGITSIGAYFLQDATSFSQNLSIPSTLTSMIGTNFMYNCKSMTGTVTWNVPILGSSASNSNFSTTDSSAAMYTTGITFDGPYGAEYAQFYANSNSSPYRKIICADSNEDYGVVYHYGYKQSWQSDGWTQGVIWEVTDSSKLDQFCQQIGNYGYSSMSFVYQGGQWVCWYNGNSTTVNDMLTQTGITVTPEYGTFQENNGFNIKKAMIVDPSTGVLKTTLTSTSDFNKLVSSTDSYVAWNLSQRTVYSEAVLSVIVGDTITSLPDNFLRNCYRIKGIRIPSSVTTIGNHCLRYNVDLVYQPLNLANVTTIGGYFMYHCTHFNGKLTLTNLTSVGQEFLDTCWQFNQPISAPALTTIGNYFMQECHIFNSSLSIPAATSIGTYFMYKCLKFDKNLTIPATVASIGTYFMYECQSMKSTLTVNCAATVASTSTYTLATTSSTAVCYTTGITLGGNYSTEWKSRFPDRTSSPYRKTIDAALVMGGGN